jgi:hypothetical protein
LAIKLRKLSRSKVTKFIAFTLAVLLITASMIQLTYINNSDVNPEIIFVEEYTQSETFIYRKLSRSIHEVINHFINDTEIITQEPEYLYYITDGEKTKHNASLEE